MTTDSGTPVRRGGLAVAMAERIATPRIGVAIGNDGVRAVVVRNGRPLWWQELPLDDDRSVEEMLRALLSALPSTLRRSVRKSTVVVAVGPGRGQIKRVQGLPPLTDAAAVERLIRTGTARFFLRNGVPLVTTGVRLLAVGEVLAAAIEQPVVDAAVHACRANGLLLSAIVPSSVALGVALRPSTLTRVIRVSDGDAQVDATFERSRLTAVRRVGSAPDAPQTAGGLAVCVEDADLVPELLVLGADAARFADAYGAAMLPDDESLVLTRASIWGTQSAAAIPRWRLIVATAAVVVCACIALAAPVLGARHAQRTAERRLAAVAAARSDATAAATRLRSVTSALQEVNEFEARRLPMTALLAALTTALPNEAAVAALRADSAGGTLVILAPRAASAIAGIDRMPLLAGTEALGPVTRETTPAGERERVTLRYRWASVPGDGASAPAMKDAGRLP